MIALRSFWEGGAILSGLVLVSLNPGESCGREEGERSERRKENGRSCTPLRRSLAHLQSTELFGALFHGRGKAYAFKSLQQFWLIELLHIADIKVHFLCTHVGMNRLLVYPR